GTSHVPGAIPLKADKHQQALGGNPYHREESVDKLVHSGVMTAAAGNLDSIYNIPAKPGQAQAAVRDLDRSPVTHIDVRYSGTPLAPGDQKPTPDFRVKADGSVEVLRNPDLNRDRRLTVEVERPPGQEAGREPPPPVQQKAVNELVDYLFGRYMPQTQQQDGTIARNGQITDTQGLVSDQTRQAEHSRPTPMDRMPEGVRHQVERINRHGGRGQFTPQEAADDFAPRDVPRQTGESDKLAAMKDIASGFMTRGERDPYHSVHTWPDQGHRVGRYGISAHQYQDWLKGMSPEEIKKLIASGQLPPGAADLQQSLLAGKDGSELTGDGKEMKDFLDKMQQGKEPLSQQEIDKNMGKRMQEQIGSDLLKSYAVATADTDSHGHKLVNVGRTALSMVLGHAVSAQEANQPQNKQIMDAAYKQYALAVMHEQNPQGNIDMSNAGGKIAAVARADVGTALWRGDLGSGNLGCASSVSNVLRQSGVANVRELSVNGLSHQLQRRGWRATSFENRQPGDVIIVDGGSRHGHTGVVGENASVTYNNHSGSGRWSRDDANYWYRRARGQRLYVLRAPSDNSSSA
ncbi:MAG TPA: hypothetical protein V6D22_25415, partial [Candidatus Obscuribacterales bacterium]